MNISTSPKHTHTHTHTQIHEVLQPFPTKKSGKEKEKNRLIKDKVGIKNIKIRVIK